MSDDPLSVFRSKFPPKAPAAPAAPRAPGHVAQAEPDDREEYQAFDNKVRPVSLEIRCHRSGLSHSIQYAHLGAVTFNFRTGKELIFSGCGLAITVRGRNLGEIARALRLHSCDLIQDYDPASAARPESSDPHAAFVEIITVEVMGGPARAKGG